MHSHPIFNLILSFLITIVVFSFNENAYGGIEGPLKGMKVKHKNDVVVMINGDRNTGEIKKMQFGVLFLKSDLAVDTLRLDWERVAEIESIARYEFETITKDRYVGIIAKGPENTVAPGYVKIFLDNGMTVEIKLIDIIAIREMERSILSRINLALDAGASYTSANSRTQTNFNLSISFKKPKYSMNLEASSQFSREPGTEDTARHEMQITATRFLRKKWEAIFLNAYLHDNQQELDLRTTIGGGVQRSFYESNRTLFYSIGGIVYTNENYFPEAQSDRNNAEALGALGFSTYRFRGSSINSLVSVFVSLTEPGRVRIDTDINWKWDIITDLYWKVSVIDNYDNTPPPNGIHHNLSLTSTIGWSF
jgi:hypothetical protein